MSLLNVQWLSCVTCTGLVLWLFGYISNVHTGLSFLATWACFVTCVAGELSDLRRTCTGVVFKC